VLYSPAFFRFTSSITEIFKRVEILKQVRRETRIFFGSSLLLQCHTHGPANWDIYATAQTLPWAMVCREKAMLSRERSILSW
jgi:hypothetical protein